jgi:hypothetical protein
MGDSTMNRKIALCAHQVKNRTFIAANLTIDEEMSVRSFGDDVSILQLGDDDLLIDFHPDNIELYRYFINLNGGELDTLRDGESLDGEYINPFVI